MGASHHGYLPFIDMSAFLSTTSSPESRAKVIADISSACRNHGYFQLIGHGISLSLQREILLAAERLFELPLEEKQAMAISKSLGMSKRGYEAIGGQILDQKPDTKEGFYVGVEVSPGDPRAGRFLIGPNFWPATLSDEEFKNPVTEYHAKVLKLHETLLRIMAAGLSYGSRAFDELMKNPAANVKLLHYPPTPPKINEDPSVGAGAHTDFGTLTILLQQPNHPGLQVLDLASDTWLSLPATEDVLVVNVGDLLQKWTKGEYRSPLHRVINICTTDRYTVPYFYHGNLEMKLSPLDGSSDGSEETAEDHIKRKLVKSFDAGKKIPQ